MTSIYDRSDRFDPPAPRWMLTPQEQSRWDARWRMRFARHTERQTVMFRQAQRNPKLAIRMRRSIATGREMRLAFQRYKREEH